MQRNTYSTVHNMEAWCNGKKNSGMKLFHYINAIKRRGRDTLGMVKKRNRITKLENVKRSDSFTELWMEIPSPNNNLVLGMCYYHLDKNAESSFDVEKKIWEASKVL